MLVVAKSSRKLLPTQSKEEDNINYRKDDLISFILNALELCSAKVDSAEDSDRITAEMGSVIRDHGLYTADNAAKLRRGLGELNDLGNLTKYCAPKHRRRLK